jgi:hypothetical protein
MWQVSMQLTEGKHSRLHRALCMQGTLPTDGAALLLSTLSHFSLQAAPPRVLCVTHCLEVGNPALLPRTAQVQLLTMAIHIQQASAQNGNQHVEAAFLYTLKPGCATSSFAVRHAPCFTSSARLILAVPAVVRYSSHALGNSHHSSQVFKCAVKSVECFCRDSVFQALVCHASSWTACKACMPA